MNPTKPALFAALSLALPLASGCGEAPSQPAPGSGWLLEAEGEDARFERVARHLRGFDLAMVEVGYRYTEVYFAAEDDNWALAAYHLDKLHTAIDNGVQRRPARGGSAAMIDAPLARAAEAVSAEDAESFSNAFERLTETCNACHRAEEVGFIRVVAPTSRLAPTRR